MKKLLYLCSEYPALSHTFIDKEIDELEKNNFEVLTASINYPKNYDKFSSDYQNRTRKTYYIKNEKKIEILVLLLKYKLLNPLKFLRVLNFAYRISVKNGVKNLKKFVGYFIESILLHDHMRKNNIKHVHIHFANPASTVAMIAKEFGGIEYSISVHGPDEFYNTKENLVKEKVKGAKFIRTISHFCTSQLMRESDPKYWNKFNIVRCGIDLNQFLPIKKQEKELFHIVCVGRLTPSKGQTILIGAVKKIIEEVKNFKLILVGGGEDFEGIKEKIEKEKLNEYIELKGPVSHETVKEILTGADVFALPSFAEGIPVALMEAMAMEIPVISTKIAGIPELIEDYKNGFLVDASDEVQLAELMIKLINGQSDLELIRRNARKKVEEKYNIEKNINGMIELFNKYI